MNIRRYEPRDRAAVREIACDTADVDWPDREILADVLTRYYTDFAPQYSWVAEMDGEVVGYLTGCVDTRRYLRTMAARIVPAALLKALARGCLGRLGPLLRRPKGDFRRTQILAEYPAHLHINFRRPYRGRGGGGELMGQFLRQAAEAGVAGVHAGVSETNTAGRRFFEKSGFVALGREPRVGGAFTILYGKKIFR
jgi:ribosomal protein S18 acetylase RimI-like enzyme